MSIWAYFQFEASQCSLAWSTSIKLGPSFTRAGHNIAVAVLLAGTIPLWIDERRRLYNQCIVHTAFFTGNNTDNEILSGPVSRVQRNLSLQIIRLHRWAMTTRIFDKGVPRSKVSKPQANLAESHRKPLVS